MNKVNIMASIDEIMDMYCQDCLVIKELRKSRGKTAAHQFCINECTVGEHLQFLGTELMKIQDELIKEKK